MSDLDGLWALRFEDFEQVGIRNGGAVVVIGPRLYGGDGHFYYLGEFSFDGTRVAGIGSINHYSGRSLSAYGIAVDESLKIEFAAEVEDGRIAGHMWPVGREQPMLRYSMERLADLQ